VSHHEALPVIETPIPAPDGVRRAQRIALIVGIVGTVPSLLGLFLDFDQFFRSYLFAYTYWTLISLGCLGLLMIQYMTQGVWGASIRRFLEAGASTIPFIGILFVPLLFIVLSHNGIVWPWVDPHVVEESHMLQAKELYLNVPFFIVRIIIYFVIWSLLAIFLNKWSAELDRNPSISVSRKLVRISAGGLLLFALTTFFASIDLVMSLDPEWFSSIFGAIFGISGILGAFSLVIILVSILTSRGPLSNVMTPAHFHDYGKLLHAFVILWAYLSFAQYLIIWSANLPFEVVWYQHRMTGGWQWIALIVALSMFLIPFLLLLSVPLKRSPKTLSIIAFFLLIAQFIHVIWITIPSIEPNEGHFRIHWLDITLLVAIGGVWFTIYLWKLASRSLIPLYVVPVTHPRWHPELEQNVAQ